MKPSALLLLLCFLSCQTEVPQNKETNNLSVYTLSDYFLLRYLGQLEEEKLVLHIANWADGTCSGNWHSPFLKKEASLKGEINLAEELELRDLKGNVFVFNFSTPEKITGYFRKAGTIQKIPVSLEAQVNCAKGLFPAYFFSEGGTVTWLISCIDSSRYIITRMDTYAIRYANLKNRKLVFETQGDSCDFIYKDKEGIIRIEKGKDCSKLDEFVSY